MKNLLDKPLDELAEEFLPYLAALALGVGLWLFFRTQPLPTKTDKLVEASINIFSILVGFIGAALAIVFAIDNKPVIAKLKQDAKYRRFIRYYFEAFIASFAALAIAFVLNGSVIDLQSQPWKITVTIWLTIVMVATLLSIRVIWLLFRVLHKNCEIEERK
jgi:hypothetical protein